MPRRLRCIASLAAVVVLVSLLTTAAGASGSKNGLLGASPILHDRIELDSTQVVAGHPMRGTLVVTNSGSSPINLTRRCYPGFLIELTNKHIPPQVSFNFDCVNRPFLIPPGTSRFDMTILTTQGCTASGGTSATPIPTCPPGGGLPALPPGQYRAVLVGDGVALPAPRPVPVTLLAPGG